MRTTGAITEEGARCRTGCDGIGQGIELATEGAACLQGARHITVDHIEEPSQNDQPAGPNQRLETGGGAHLLDQQDDGDEPADGIAERHGCSDRDPWCEFRRPDPHGSKA